ncbi:MAG: OPT/YSL family transporter [Myxococcales bacterium]|nr:OPT/YSL family transporter [Myxococcales bacterium]
MPLLQSPPRTPEELERARPLAISPDQVQQMDEETWYREVYRGEDVPQLTLRAVVVGSGLGFLLAFTNLYVGLMTGWGLGVAITSAILSYGLWNTLLSAGVAKTPMTILETNCMASTASSAGYATGSTMVSAIPALLMLSVDTDHPHGTHLVWWVLGGWTLLLGILGTSLAVPMKRSMINRERLTFPSGTAAAVTLQSLYSEGAAAMRKARALLFAGFFGAVFPPLLQVPVRLDESGERTLPLLPSDTPIFDFLHIPAVGTHVADGHVVANKPSDWTMTLDHDPIMIAAGAIVGPRVAVWMMVGALLLAYVVGPFGALQEWTNPDGDVVLATTAPYKAWKEIGIWFGVPIMVSASLLQFATQWRTILRAAQGLLGGGKAAASSDLDEKVAATEVPTTWFAIGTAIGGGGAVALGAYAFHIPMHYGLLAVILTFALALVACRATGESDITPIGAMGKLMQLTYGVLIPQSTTANLMTASITSNCAASAADLLSDLKSGYLLGANPRRQFLAQLSGVFTGTLATVGGFYVLVPNAEVLTGVGDQPPTFPAPAAQSWKAVAEVFQHGISNMHPTHQQAMVVGALLGIAMVSLELALPKYKQWLPSATGLSLGLILTFNYPLSMFIGAMAAVAWRRINAQSCEEYLVPISSGVIAGSSILGVIVAFINNVVLA